MGGGLGDGAQGRLKRSPGRSFGSLGYALTSVPRLPTQPARCHALVRWRLCREQRDGSRDFGGELTFAAAANILLCALPDRSARLRPLRPRPNLLPWRMFQSKAGPIGARRWSTLPGHANWPAQPCAAPAALPGSPCRWSDSDASGSTPARVRATTSCITQSACVSAHAF
jgi:hypothetical protein